jgi:hypothetical protein
MQPIVASFVGYVHPCGAISVGLVPRPKTTADERRNQTAHNKIELRRLNTPNGTELADALARQLDAGQITVVQAVEAISSLGSSSLQNSRNSQIDSNHQVDNDPNHPAVINPSKTYGQNGITSRGRLRVRDGATILEQKYGRRSLAFATVTLPPMAAGQLELVCENWGEYVHRLTEEIKRELQRHNAPVEIIYCTEIQEKRYINHGQIAPHLHLLWYAYELDIHGVSTGKYAISADFLRELNHRIITRIIGNNDIPTGASVDIQRVKKSAANYLGKYMSKGGKVVDKIKLDGHAALLPRTWWGMTKELRQEVVKAIQKIIGDTAKNLFYHGEKLKAMGVFARYNEVIINRSFCNHQTAEVVNAEIRYGMSAQLSHKLMNQNQLLVSILDICDMIDEDVCTEISAWISAIKNGDMCDDVIDMLRDIKNLLLEEINDNELVDMVTGEIFIIS